MSTDLLHFMYGWQHGTLSLSCESLSDVSVLNDFNLHPAHERNMTLMKIVIIRLGRKIMLIVLTI